MVDNSKEVLLENIDKIHTTALEHLRIRTNLCLSDKIDVVEFCKKVILHPKAVIYKQGKNFYVILDDIKITVNSFNFSIITAKKIS